MFKRMQDRGQKIVLNLFLENQSVRGASSNNLIAEVKGSSIPDEIVLFGGHMDSWDTGT
jgi:carboxypeptidase Q